MALHFLVEQAGACAVGELVTLTGAEAKHAAVVRRLRVGEEVTVGDGRGVWLSGVAEEVSPTRVDVRVAERIEHPPATPRVVLVQALAKGDRDELAVQAACELGVDEIVPWQAGRSVSRWEGPKAAKGRERWASIVREAAKQAHRAWVPEVAPVETTAQLAARAASQRVLLLDPTARMRLSTLQPDGRDLVLVVGPEGGISPEELARLEAAGAERVLLGDTVLRTSTAGPAAIAVLSAALGRW
ncbi:16S rRNA (uracil(1498)-N(3))-methyltransferase [Microbacterium sp. p3-SID336]|uniref:16S rRNA (uracil(1498)-N(3))-methyltransferase n=1 Tax=Microbacterium sp. p3-SID336 TaxID=2916212 RepID=UPI0021A7FA6E|nr:16S rRNA (uracil(1498)-N(3))-methyltransferase [Microbacterium sp. p3-SID336]MCT1478378.1 16S rRNA (uracil(1498)-N(3))-methyltransferase [Microbacterium sp. p3-SID336]